MNLRPLYILGTLAAIGVGGYLGWQDAIRGAKPRDDTEAAEPRGDSESESETNSPDRAGDNAKLDTSDNVDDRDAGDESEKPSPVAPPTKTKAATDAELKTLADIRREISSANLTRALELSSALLSSSKTLARPEAERLRARAQVLRALIPDVKRKVDLSKLHEVSLHNGSRLVATQLEEKAGQVTLTLRGGITYKVAKDDIASIKKSDAKAYRKKRWKLVESRISKYKHPIDIYVRGVTKCYQEGFAREGYQLLVDLIDEPGGEQVARFFGVTQSESDGPNLVDLWRLARDPKARRASSPEVAIATVDSQKTESTASESGTNPRTEVVTEAPSGRPAIADEDPPELTKASAGDVRKIQGLLNQARAIYRKTIGKDGQDKQVKQAYELLRDAQDMISTLAPSEEVNQLGRELSQQLFDVGRSLPFDY